MKQGRGCVQQCLPGRFPAHQASNFPKPVLGDSAAVGSLRPGFDSWKGTHKPECAESSSRNRQHCLKCHTVGRCSLCQAGAAPVAAVALQGTTPWDGGAAGAVWGEQSQLHPQGGAGLSSSRGWEMPGRAGAAPTWPLGASRAGLVCSVVQRREITCGSGMLCRKDTAGLSLGQQRWQEPGAGAEQNP